MNALFRFVLVIGLAFSITLAASTQEDDACPALVETALARVGDACSNLGRNQLCYGHGNIVALDFERAPLAGFESSGDRSNIVEVYSLATTPMDVTQGGWGVAVLALQADLPGTIPGQNVIFVVYGDTQLINEVAPENVTAPPPTRNAPGTIYTAPMQAFRLITGLGEPACEEAPRDGLLVQAPTDATVHFLVNGIQIEVGSTALLQLDDQTLGVNTFDGSVSVTSAGRTEIAQPGQRVDVTAGQVPAPPVPYQTEDVSGAPVDLLPEPVSIPPPAGSHVGIVPCAAEGGSVVVPAGQPLAVRFGWADATREQVLDYASIAEHSLVFDGQPVELWGTTEQVLDEGYVRHWWWVILDPMPGTYNATVNVDLPHSYSDSTGGAFPAGVTSYSCAITVQ